MPENNDDMIFLPESPETPNFGPPPGEPENMPATPSPPYPLPTPSIPSMPPQTPTQPRPPQTPQRPNVIIRPIPLPSRPPQNNIGQGFCTIRFLHAATGQQPVNIAIGNKTVVNNLQYGEVSSYFTEPEGFQTIFVTNNRIRRMVIARDVFLLHDQDVYTIALINSRNGLALFLISDAPCRNGRPDYSCVRAVGLSYNAPALDVTVSGGDVRFQDIRFKTIAPYRQIINGTHDFDVTETDTGMQVLSLTQSVEAQKMYTLYLIGDAYVYPGIEGVFVEDFSGY